MNISVPYDHGAPAGYFDDAPDLQPGEDAWDCTAPECEEHCPECWAEGDRVKATVHGFCADCAEMILTERYPEALWQLKRLRKETTK